LGVEEIEELSEETSVEAPASAVAQELPQE
jgi:hypothetical protein